ncbi:hypothetical protein N7492_000237 [Penicillium capsulatum]|uniref:Zn(2)-C6 fungal-type domain-containing protein n=1 Tax=Penicillium capsulatum TaxID=69766 RepID=A0A9W9LYC9_9EURO|nr:hypothetical protein N7492_000237 [Penicillium capsulatum]KAJ6130697.1 hypothetical protein N7512_003477 [Penicillium capsulatum]
MSAATSTPNRATGENPPSQKLKDSCDMCSSSKVKCNKEKPVCGRCRKLGYPCFYSPARRIGRPHPSRRNGSNARKSPDLQRHGSYTDRMPSMPATPKDTGLPTSDAHIQRAPTIMSTNGTTPAYSQNAMHWLDELYLSGGAIEDPERSVATPMALQGGFSPGKELPGLAQTPLADPSQIFNFDSLVHDHPYWAPSMTSEADTSILPLEHHPTHSSEASSVENNELLVCGQAPSHSAETDCVSGAIEILRRLQTTSTGRCSSDEQYASMSTAGSDLAARVQVASSAINRLSTILVCPCSQKTYVAILVASVCLAIMDVYDALFQRPHENRLMTMSPSAPGTNIDSMLSMPMDLDSVSLGVSSLDSIGTVSLSSVEPLPTDDLDPHVSSMQVLEELSKLANVVMQFSRRYKCDVRSQSAKTLSALADSLKLRLRLVTNEAIERSSIH